MRTQILPAAALLLLTCASVPLAQGPAPAFEVATVKRNPGAPRQRIALQPGGRFVMENGTAAQLIQFAYAPRTRELEGAPSWVHSERYDVSAKAEDASASSDNIRAMLRSFLEERFKLAAHQELRDQPVYHLVVARSDGQLGPLIRRSELNCAVITEAQRQGRPVEAAAPANGAPPCGMTATAGVTRVGGMSIAVIPGLLSAAAGRPVIDATGLDGLYEFTWAPPRTILAPGATSASVDDQPSVFTALEEQLGLRLEPSRASLPIFVIDRIERPTED